MKNYILTGLVALGLLISGCGENQIGVDDALDDPVEGNAVMYITLQGSSSSIRAIDSGNDLHEDDVMSFAAYVFHNVSGALEKREVFPNGVTQGVIDGLGSTTPKRVVVLVNYPGAYPGELDYEDLLKVTLGLDSQDPASITTNGLFMSGETANIMLSETVPNNITVDVSRVVAKVRLVSLKIDPTIVSQIDDFTLEGVSMQRVRDETSIYAGLLDVADFDYVGGSQLPSQIAFKKDYLYEDLVLPNPYTINNEIIDADEIPYFYVFPNDDSNDSSTLMSIHGTYQGDDIYFNFEINNEVGAQPSTTTGDWIRRNIIYEIYVTIEGIATGDDDPNVPLRFVSANVIVNVLDWSLTIEQYVIL